MKKSILIAAALLFVSSNAMADAGPSGFADDGQRAPEQRKIKSLVKHCVDLVHQSPDRKDFRDYDVISFYRSFDAYFNAATQQVVNSATMVGDQKPLFVFQKCMSENGLPLQ